MSSLKIRRINISYGGRSVHDKENTTAKREQEMQEGPGLWLYLHLHSQEELTAHDQAYLARAASISEAPDDKP